MAIGTLTPTTWNNGTVGPATWFKGVTDNINGWIAGTGPTFKSLQIDGTGGASSATTAGDLVVSGRVISNTTTTKNFWVPGLSATFSTGWTLTTGAPQASGASSILYLYLPVRYAGFGAADIIDTVSLRVQTAGASALNLRVSKVSGLSGTGVVGVLDQGTVNTTGAGDQTISLSSLALTPSSDQLFVIRVTSGQNLDLVYGANVTVKSTVW